MKKEAIQQLFHSFASKKVLVIGDVMMDSYLWGKVDRISPEAPVPIVSCFKRENRLGGAANVALNLLALDVKPLLCGVIGDDDAGKAFINVMKDNQLDPSGILTLNDRPTTVKTRVIGGKQQLLRVDEETSKPLKDSAEEQFIQHTLTFLKNHPVDAIIFQDYDKGVITENLIKSVTEEAKKLNIPTLVDPKKRNFMAYQGVTLFKPNWKEFTEGLKLDLPKDDINLLFGAGQKFQKQQNIKLLMVTLSERGVLISHDGQYHHIPAHIRDIADVSGAGDTVISLAAVCMACGLNPRQVAAISNLAGGLVCEKVGVVPVNKEQLEAELILHADSIF